MLAITLLQLGVCVSMPSILTTGPGRRGDGAGMGQGWGGCGSDIHTVE